MTDFKLTRNGSGYYDETAYKAMNSLADSGEIWRCVFEANISKEVLVVKNHGTFSTVLGCVDDDAPERIEIVLSDRVKYTDPRMLRFVYNQNFSQRTDILDTDTFNEITSRIHACLPHSESNYTVATSERKPQNSTPSFHLGEIRKIFGDENTKAFLRCMYVVALKNNMPETANECLKHIDHIYEIINKQRSVNNG